MHLYGPINFILCVWLLIKFVLYDGKQLQITFKDFEIEAAHITKERCIFQQPASS